MRHVRPSIEVDDDPHGFWARAASHLAVPEAIEQALAQLPAKQVEGLGELLDALAAEGLNESPPDARGDRPRVRRLGARGAGGDPRAEGADDDAALRASTSGRAAT